MKNLVVVLIIYSFISNSVLAQAPPNFVNQVLEPTGGKLLKPDSWHYMERHRAANSLYWVVSKEDPTTGYDTGLAIQFMIGIKEGTGLSPEAFTKNRIEQIMSATSVIQLCPQDEVGEFSRICLKIEETQNREGIPNNFTVLYSFFWSDSLDSVGITIAGSPSKTWSQYSEIFHVMNKVELIDPKRFK